MLVMSEKKHVWDWPPAPFDGSRANLIATRGGAVHVLVPFCCTSPATFMDELEKLSWELADEILRREAEVPGSQEQMSVEVAKLILAYHALLSSRPGEPPCFPVRYES